MLLCDVRASAFNVERIRNEIMHAAIVNGGVI